MLLSGIAELLRLLDLIEQLLLGGIIRLLPVHRRRIPELRPVHGLPKSLLIRGEIGSQRFLTPSRTPSEEKRQ